MNESPVRNRLLLAGAAALFSTGGAVIKMATLTPWQVASFRSAIAAAALLIVLPEARRHWSWRLAPAAVAYAATLALFVLATRSTTAANAIFLQSTAPLYLLLLGPFILHEPVRRSDIVFALAIAAGMTLFFFDRQSALGTAPAPGKGNLLAAASGLTWALTVMGLRWIGRSGEENRAIATVALGNVIAFLATLPMVLPITSPRPTDVLVILYLGVAQIGLAYVCLARAIRHVAAFEATAILLLEPVLNPIWAWLVHRETPGAFAVAGGLIILTATAVNTWRQAARGH